MVFLDALGFCIVYITTSFAIRRFRNAQKGTGAEMRLVIFSVIVTGDTLVSYWPILSPVSSNHGNSFVSLSES